MFHIFNANVINIARPRTLRFNRRNRPVLANAAHSSGFTLVESLIALCILAFGLAGLANLMVGSLKTGREARRFTAAGSLAQQKLEALRGAGYTSAASSASNESLTENGDSAGVTMFTRNWTVANGGTAGTKNVTVTVSWTDDLGAHQVQLQSKMAS